MQSSSPAEPTPFVQGGGKMLLHWLVLTLVFGYPQQESPKPEEQAAAQQQASLLRERHRQAAIRMNELAAHINSEADARAFVDAVADMFADSLPPAWATRGIRERIARAEYEAVSDPLRQVPEQRIADVWNKYVREIGASEEAVVTVAGDSWHARRGVCGWAGDVDAGNESELVDDAELFRRWRGRQSGGGVPCGGGASR